MYFLRYYWNKDLFPYALEPNMDMLLVYCISMFIVDIITGVISFYLINRDLSREKSYLSLVKDFYSYPKVGAILSFISLLSIQYTYTALFFTQQL